MQQHSRSRRSDFLTILAAVRNGMAVLLTGRPTVISLSPGGMHGSCIPEHEPCSVQGILAPIDCCWGTETDTAARRDVQDSERCSYIHI